MADVDPQISVTLVETEKPRRRWLRLGFIVSLPLLLVIAATAYYLANDHYVSTDNAYVQQNKVSVSAEVGGRIVAVAVQENQQVKAGDLLFKIDPEPYRLAISQADADMAAAQVKVATLTTDLSTTGVDIASANEDVAFFEQEYRRQSTLMQQGFTTRARLQSAEHALSDARSKLATARGDAEKARVALTTGNAAPGVNPGVLAGRVKRDQALLNLTRTEIRAPVAGVISQSDRLQLGQMMVQGLPAVSIVSNNQSWIEANFKETDLDKMRLGQIAKVTFDAYPNLTLKGRVSSIGAGTGSEFSVLPAQNANGNWVKVTQRVPVRIAIEGKPPRQLIAGLSAHVRVDTGE